jgi:uncharacterized protein YjbI with pentapeptide repeats
LDEAWWRPDPEHVAELLKGVDSWNKWRESHPRVQPILRNINLKGVDLRGASLSNVEFGMCNLSGAKLNHAELYQAEFYGADLRAADLSGAGLRGAKLHETDLRGADLRHCDLFRADFINTKLEGAKLGGARCVTTAFSNVELSGVLGLEEVVHAGPSNIDSSTLFKLKEPIPERFLRGAGLPDILVQYLPSLIASVQPVQFYSCFISYNHKDEAFAERLYSRMRDADLRVWFAPDSIRGGQKIHEQIDRAIQVHDRLLLVLSENSVRSEWVMTELRKARKAEVREKRRKLFPIRLMGYDAIRDWECFDADTGKDLAVEVREYFIPDFSGWRDDNSFETAFQRLLRDLKSEAGE